MAEKKKGKQRKVEEEPVTKEEYAVAKYLRFGLPVREGKLHGMEVKCFFGNAAVDKLLESKWSATKNKKDPLFTTRATCVTYMLRLLEKGLFHRAEREKRKKDKDKERPKKKKKDGDREEITSGDAELRERKTKKEKKSKKEKEGEATADDETEKAEKTVEKKDEKKKKEKRLKLVMPDQQFFEDGDEVYIWIYDPVNAKTFLIGLLMVLGAIALCMFPLWPEEVRVGVYYLSLAASGFVGFILSLVVVRLVLFCCIWALTFGKHHFWFLPNLTEDVGFFDSFRPLYKHDFVDKSAIEEGKKKKKKDIKEETQLSTKKKEKSSDKDDSDEFEVIKKEDLDTNEDNEGNNDGDDNEDENGPGDEEEEDYEDDNNEEENGESEEDEEEEDEGDESNPDLPAEAKTEETKKTK